MTLKEIANRIAAHLRRFERDPKINVRQGTSRYYHTGAYAGGRVVMVVYVCYHGPRALTKEQAEKYLAWLDAGNVGTYRDGLRETAEKA